MTDIHNKVSEYFEAKKLLSVLALMTFLFLGGAAQKAMASEPVLLKQSKQWSAYTFIENGNKVCYMASIPNKAEGNYTRRGDIFAIVAHRPAENVKDVFSYIAGYDYMPGSDVRLTIDGKKFTLLTQDDTAWAPDAQTDKNLADAIRKGSNLIVTGTSKRGTKTTDTFSLSGSSAAYESMSKACGM